MNPVSNTARYLKITLVIFCFITVVAAADTALWHHVTTRMQAQIENEVANLKATGWSVETGEVRRRGWPFGAWIEIQKPQLSHKNLPAQPFEAGWAGETFRLGGPWTELVRNGLTVSLPGRQAARIITSSARATILTEALRLHISEDGTVMFHAPSAQVAVAMNLMDQTVALSRLSGRILIQPQAPAGATRLGLDVLSSTVGTSFLNVAKYPLHNAHLVVALTTSSTHPESPLFSPEGYERLLVQTASFSMGSEATSAHLSFSGELTYPALNGHLTLTLLNWHDAAEKILNIPRLQASLAPDTRVFLEHILHATPSSGLAESHPVVAEVSVVNGHAAPALEQLLQTISTQKIDASHLRE